ncbi:MAG: extracellular solute-binding protein [Clostridia bacterium]|nr:extracellular solute-binding protein [Clostridia bacterium]
MKNFFKTIVRILFVALAAAMLISVVACEPREYNSGELPDDYIPDIKGKLKVSCMNHVYPDEQSRRGIRNWLNVFRDKYPEVTIETDFNVTNYAPLISSKTLGDVFFMTDGGIDSSDSLYQYAITNEAMMQLDYYIELYGIDTSDIYSGIMNLSEINGHTYMVCMTCGNVLFTYNKDALVEAGILAPDESIPNDWTWDTFKDYCARLKQYDVDGITLTQVGAAWKFDWQNMFTPFLYAYGGKWYDKENKRVSFDNDLVRKGIGEAINLIDDRLVYPMLNKGLGAQMSAEYKKISQYNSCVFNFNESYTVLSQNVKRYNNKEWDAVAFPLFPYASSPCGSLGFGVFSYTRNKDAAAALALSLLTEDGQYALHEQEGGDVPVIQKLGEMDFWHLKGPGFDGKNYEAFTANYERYVPGQIATCVPPDVANIIQDGIGDLFANYCKNAASWQDALQKLEQKCNDTWDTLNGVD